MTSLNKWGIYPNFNVSRYAKITSRKLSKKIVKFAVIPKNGRSIPLYRKFEQPFSFKGKKLTQTIRGKYTIGKNKKRHILLTQGFQIIVEKA